MSRRRKKKDSPIKTVFLIIMAAIIMMAAVYVIMSVVGKIRSDYKNLDFTTEEKEMPSITIDTKDEPKAGWNETDKGWMYYLDEKEYVVRTVMKINTEMPGAYVFSSGKNMGTFKAVGYPEDIGIFYKLDEYEGYSWTAHGRYPTNTPGWWGGAHPFALLDSSVVHNGEISSYDANRRFMEMFGYKCTLQTDTEVITYILDYLLRRQNLTLGEAASVIAAPFWSTIAAKTDLADQKKHTYLRTLFPSLLITGPFSIVFGFNGGLMALNDRLKLRSMVVGEKKDMVYIASEETAIRAMEPDAENIWAPAGGEPVIVTVKEGVLL